jgi:predicted lipid-binding transport protein (Tim44 family)
MTILRQGILALALAALFALMVDAADARVGGGGSAGSRGSRTYAPPPTTNTAPKPASPMDRSMAQPGTKSVAPGAPAAGPMASRFGSGFGGLLLGGLLGAGLFGLLSGSGLFGGLSGLAGVLGLMLQVALIAGAVYLVVAFIRSRNQPAMARSSLGGGGGQGGGGGVSYGGPPGVKIGGGGLAPASSALMIGSADYDAFEKILIDIQGAFAREDSIALADLTTPEMLSYLSHDLADYRKRNVRNEVRDVKLLQGDLAEAWTEDGSDYATVAMRFSMIDATFDRTSGELVAGDRNTPQEMTEIWTFRRDHRDAERRWELSAIQQA